MHFIDSKHEINRAIAWFKFMHCSYQNLFENIEHDDGEVRWHYVQFDFFNDVCYIKGVRYNFEMDSFNENNYIFWLWL